MSEPTLAELHDEHMRGKHRDVPAFACRGCIQARDAFWVCECDHMLSLKETWCSYCQCSAPESVIERALVPRTTPIKAESNR